LGNDARFATAKKFGSGVILTESVSVVSNHRIACCKRSTVSAAVGTLTVGLSVSLLSQLGGVVIVASVTLSDSSPDQAGFRKGQVVNSHLVCDPTIRQPGFDLPR